VPGAGQGEQIQRVGVTDRLGTLKMLTMSARVNDNYCSNPRVTWVVYGQKIKSPTVTAKNVLTEGKSVCTINNK
jgi:hypothetical protein